MVSYHVRVALVLCNPILIIAGTQILANRKTVFVGSNKCMNQYQQRASKFCKVDDTSIRLNPDRNHGWLWCDPSRSKQIEADQVLYRHNHLTDC